MTELITGLRNELKTELNELKTEFNELKTELKTEVNNLNK